VISVIVPSRGRPHNIVELIAAWEATRTLTHSFLVVVVDDDDPELDGYREVALEHAHPWWVLVVGLRRRLGPTLNDVAPNQALTGNHVGFMGDDHRPRTVGWDEKIDNTLNALPLGVVYGDDLVQREALPTAVFLHHQLVFTLGYMVPPGMIHLYLDDYWKLLGTELGTLTYLPDVVIEHCHPVAGTAVSDAGYAEVNAPEMYAHDGGRFREFVEHGEFEASIAKLVTT
jgi:hypothetical protein